MRSGPSGSLHGSAFGPRILRELAVLLALRRQSSPAVAQFLSDSDPALVKEAARAIVDGGIEAALPELAKLAAKQLDDDKLTYRVLDAAFRSGDAMGLAGYAAD